MAVPAFLFQSGQRDTKTRTGFMKHNTDNIDPSANMQVQHVREIVQANSEVLEALETLDT